VRWCVCACVVNEPLVVDRDVGFDLLGNLVDVGAEGALAAFDAFVDEQRDGHLRPILVTPIEIAHSPQHVFHCGDKKKNERCKPHHVKKKKKKKKKVRDVDGDDDDDDEEEEGE